MNSESIWMFIFSGQEPITIRGSLIEDVFAFLIIHSTFLLTIPFFIALGWNQPLTKSISIFVSLTYAKTLSAWVFGLGNDFGLIFYFGMYVLAPAICSCCFLDNKGPSFGKLLGSYFLVLPFYLLFGVLTLYITIQVVGVKW